MYERDYGPTTQSRRRPEARPPRRRRRRRRRNPGGVLLTCLAVGIAAALLYSALQMPPDPAAPQAPDLPSGSGEPGEPSAQQPADPLAPQVPQLPDEPGDPAEPGEPAVAVSPDDWNLMLVNPWHAMPKDYELTLEKLSNGHSVDKRCYNALQDMLSACRAAGLQPVICSSYRTWDKQESLYQNKVNRLINQGYSQADALVEAGKVVAVPGTSEHQLGLAVDIVDVNNQNLDESQEKTEVQKWLMEHSYEYGFILRYPNDKSEITGIIYEPWHYRYVGTEAAREMFNQGICLEEYLESLEK